jgi:sporulation protein YlmC with PRC-barrel domain
MKNATIGQQVVRSKGDYVVGRIGNVVAIDAEKTRAQVEWSGNTKTWVSFSSLEPTSIPYEIVRPANGARGYSKYQPKPAEQFATHKVMYNGKECDAINFGAL